MQQAVNCLRLSKLYDQCTRFHPKERPDAKYIVDVLGVGNEEQPNSRDLPLTVSQGSSVVNANCENVPDDGTNSCAFLSVHFADVLMCQNEKSTVSKFEDIANLAEEVIINSPLKFNSVREKSRHYDVSEAYTLLWNGKVVEENYEFSEEIISSHGVYSACAREELIAAVYQLTTETKMRLAFYSCGGYIFTIGWAFGHLFIMDTHAISEELGGNGKGLVKVFLQEKRRLAAENLCSWVWKRLSQSGVRSCAQQSLAETRKSSSKVAITSGDTEMSSCDAEDLNEEAHRLQVNDSPLSPSRSPLKKKAKRCQRADRNEDEMCKRRLNLDMSSQTSKIPDAISIDISKDKNQQPASARNQVSDAVSRADISKNSDDADYHSCESISSDSDGECTNNQVSNAVSHADISKNSDDADDQSYESISSSSDGERVESDDDDSKKSLSGSGSPDLCNAAFYLDDKHIPVYASDMRNVSNVNIARLLLEVYHISCGVV